ncbi:MAG: hypothetical protein NE330_06955, partial [Lentisphaeraceae bacterium]|nr:hypothetical protein [Lentisphaeraceae bacterium]
LSSKATGSKFSSTDDLPSAACPERPLRFGYGHNTDNLGRVKLGHSMTYVTRLGEADKPHETVLFTDNTAPGGSSEEWTGNKWKPHTRGSLSPFSDAIVDFRHLNSANVVWLDVHVTSRKNTDGFLRVGDAVSESRWWDIKKN